MLVRYIRDWSGGSNANWAAVWQEVQAFVGEENVALGKPVDISGSWNGYLGWVTDGIINDNDYVWLMRGVEWVLIDLLEPFNIDTIKVWHYYDGRIFDDTKTEVSVDGVNWFTVFDSAIEGTYSETIEGLTIPLIEQETSLELSRDLKKYAVVPHRESLNVTTHLTMEFWIKLKPLPNDFQAIIDKGNIGTTQYYVIHEARNGNNQIKYRFGNGHERTVNRPNTIIDKWTHMAFTFNGAEMIFYEDGIEIVKENFPNFYFTPNTMDLTFGRMSASDGAFLDAFLDEIRIWNVVRNKPEIQEGMSGVDPSSNGLIGYWKMNNSGSYLEDYSINGNHGFLKNGASFSSDQPLEIGPSAQNFEQIAQLDLNFSEAGEKIYTPKGYDFAQWAFTSQDVYFYADSVYTLNGYEYNQSSINVLPALNTEATQAYEMIGYSFKATSGLQEIILDYGATQNYELKGYSFEQKSQDLIFFSFVGAASYNPEGYDVAAMAQENILLVVAASQMYTLKGLSFEAGTEMILIDLVDAAALSFQANFEMSKQESFFLEFEASQNYAAHFESSVSLVLDLAFDADEIYTAVGYDTENVIVQSIDLDYDAVQVFAAHFEALGIQNILFSNMAWANAVFSNGLQFQQSNVDHISLTFGAVQTFEAFEGFRNTQNSSDLLDINDSVTLLYELGEIGKYSQRASLKLYLQVDSDKEYAKNFLTFGSVAEENINSFTVLAVNEYTQAHIFEASGLNELSLVDAAASKYDQNYLAFEMKVNEFIASHFTDISIHTVNFLSFNQEMYYDFLFWADAYSLYDLERKSFESLIPANFNLSFGASSEYTRGYIFDAGSSENIELVVQASLEYQHINMFIGEAVESLYFEAFGTFRVTTESRSYEMEVQVFLDLAFASWVYFEDDIYDPTYKLEITKPNTLWEPLPEDRVMVDANKVPSQGMDYSDTSFGRSHNNLIDRRIVGLTHIKEPTKISYEAEIRKPNTLYSITENDKGGAFNNW